ncbi:MAG: UDP-N-acetylmuramoyl-tripeptide--D-alanyl-D-alanine ligase [Methylobacillus sp.]|nr:UDP-N-acetylmuramoyl-tripeptide--D-alanyl-D-alanine ligase [Methylobacillus sp.]
MMRLSEAATAVNGKVVGHDAMFGAVFSDSRAIAPGDLFVALKGENFDGHDFVADCLQRKAAAALVNADWSAGNAAPLLQVADTKRALGALAAYWRGKFRIPVAAVTGSNGKTTVKEMLAAILRQAAGNDDAVLATQGNLNNDIGMPLTLLKLRDTHRCAVIEMGMNHAGEIDTLTRIAHPDVALINNASGAHLEGLGSVEAVAQAKGEIFAGLRDDGIAVFNADDKYAALWGALAKPHRVVDFGIAHEKSAVNARWQAADYGSQLAVNTPAGTFSARLNVPGEHNVRNALAATAAAVALEIPLTKIVAGLESFDGVKGRLQRKPGKRGAVIIDDTYNANPASMRAAIDVLAACGGKRILVLGDMGELGADAERFHAEIGAYAKAAGLETLLALGDLGRETAAGFGSGATHFDTPENLVAALEKHLSADTTVLVKGSRFMKMERVVNALVTQDNNRRNKHVA